MPKLVAKPHSPVAAEKTRIATQRTKIEEQQILYKDQLTNQFSKMTSRVAAYKSIQDYLEQQVAVWTKDS